MRESRRPKTFAEAAYQNYQAMCRAFVWVFIILPMFVILAFFYFPLVWLSEDVVPLLYGRRLVDPPFWVCVCSFISGCIPGFFFYWFYKKCFISVIAFVVSLKRKLTALTSG
jgi:hypothetical protein